VWDGECDGTRSFASGKGRRWAGHRPYQLGRFGVSGDGTGKVPKQFAVILILDQPGDFSLPQLRQLIADRIVALPRLRQRLIKVPPGCGRAVWVDDADFHIDRHVRAVPCRAPGDEAALLDAALSVIMTPLPKDAPLWSVVLITDLADGGLGVVVVLHDSITASVDR
jgi:diacylglycerol O-acyltransferase / wax synthase